MPVDTDDAAWHRTPTLSLERRIGKPDGADTEGAMAWTTTKSTTTKHSHPVVFGRREPGCPRCAELDSGAPPIRWAGVEMKRRSEAARSAAIYAHDCKSSGCGPVCTFGDW